VVRLRVDVCVCPFFRGYCKDKAQSKLRKKNISIKKMLKQPSFAKATEDKSGANIAYTRSTVFAFSHLQIAGNNQ